MFCWHLGIYPIFIDILSKNSIVVKYNNIDGDGDKSVKKLSKSQKIIKSLKSSRAWKVTKIIDLEEPSFLTFDIRLTFTKMDSSYISK